MQHVKTLSTCDVLLFQMEMSAAAAVHVMFSPCDIVLLVSSPQQRPTHDSCS
jgi:hypothetical protein